MKIHGNRVYLLMPDLPDSQVKLLPETQEKLKEEMRSKFDRLIVYAVGEGIPRVTINVKAGDEVFVDPNAVRRGIFFKIDDKEVLSVSHMDIMHTW